MKVKSIKIFDLWGIKNIEWNFADRLNFLTGKNGTGKSSILDALFLMTFSGYAIDADFASAIEVHFEDDTVLKATPPFSKQDPLFNNFTIQKSSKVFDVQDYLKKNVNIVTISTFDTPLYSLQEMQVLDKLKDNKRIRTELDYEIFIAIPEFYLQISQQYSSIQSEIQKATSTNQIRKKLFSILERNNQLIVFLNEMFADSNKSVNMESGKLEIKDELNRIVTPYQLSSGEKQLLYIALKVFLANDKKSIILMDEPELSLHTEWQRKLMSRLIDISPNCQFIIVTHAPSSIPNGFPGCTVDINQISKSTKQKQQ